MKKIVTFIGVGKRGRGGERGPLGFSYMIPLSAFLQALVLRKYPKSHQPSQFFAALVVVMSQW